MTDPNQDKKKKQQILLGGGIAIVLLVALAAMFFMDSSKPDDGAEAKTSVDIVPPGTIEDKDAWRADQAAQDHNNTEDIASMREMVTQLKTSQDATNQVVNELAERQTKIGSTSASNQIDGGATYSSPISPPSNISGYPKVDNPSLKQGVRGQQILSDPNSPIGASDYPLNVANSANAIPAKTLEIIRFDGSSNTATNGKAGSADETIGFPVTPEATKIARGSAGSAGNDETFIPEGSFMRVLMINGVDAPTGSQAKDDPLPVVFENIDPINMPNGYKVNVKGCRFLGYAWGVLSTERMMSRIETGNCIINGQTVKVDLKAHVMGEDGKPGVRGRVVTKQGQLLANAALASALESIGSLYKDSQGTTSTTSLLGVTKTISKEDIKKAGIGGGISGGAEKLSDFYLQRANDVFPIIESDAGRIVELLVTKGVVVRGLQANGRQKLTSTRQLKDD